MSENINPLIWIRGGGDSGISLDLMIKALLRLGTSKREIGKLIKGEEEQA